MEIEGELNGHPGVSKLEQFVRYTRQGSGVKEASQILGVTDSYASRMFKHTLVNLLAEKLILKLKA